MDSKKSICIDSTRCQRFELHGGGVISLLGHTTRALFDLVATHSFISSAFAYKLNQSPESLGFQLVISTMVGVEMISSTRYKDCEVVIGEVT